MRFSVRGLDDVFTYPCTKTDVREAFGDDLLESAWFSGDFHLDSRQSHRQAIQGKVLLGLSVSIEFRSDPIRQHATLHVYRLERVAWSELLHWNVREAMRTALLPWCEAMLNRPEIAWGGYDVMLVELREGRLLTHATKIRTGLE